jgi:multicomponent Na+:H+ antiporter subunit A
MLLLILAGAFTKSAQIPFHFWLPGAMEAPTPVSADLHSATMVKAGVYLLARLQPILGETDVWHYVITTAGAATMLLGAVMALPQTDLKRLLAYSTVSALGTLMLLLGLGTTLAVKAAMVFLLVHSLYKGALFLIAGIIDHETGTRDIDRLGGLRHAMPITAVAVGLAALSMAGLPPLFGFISKELLYEAKLQAPQAAPLITGAGVLANMVLVAVAGIVSLSLFSGPQTITPKNPHEAPFSLWFGPLLLAGLGLVIGLFPDALATPLIAPAVSAVRAEPAEIKLALWHGVNPILALSIITVACGVGVYAGRSALRQAVGRLDFVTEWGPLQWYTVMLDGLNALARIQTRLLQSGYLRLYVLVSTATIVGLTLVTFVTYGILPDLVAWPQASFAEWMFSGIILMGALAAIRAASLLAAVVALGVVGYGVALIYILFSAPDLAMTQVAVETLTVVLFVLVLSRRPLQFADLSSTAIRIRDGVLALAAGGLMTALILTVTAEPMRSRLVPYFAENSLLLAKGRNVVNVILVDFRALDTLGEITVLAVAAIGVYTLLKLRLRSSSGS